MRIYIVAPLPSRCCTFTALLLALLLAPLLQPAVAKSSSVLFDVRPGNSRGLPLLGFGNEVVLVQNVGDPG